MTKHTVIIALVAAGLCLAENIELQASYRAVRQARARQLRDGSAAANKALGAAYHAAGQHLLFRLMMERAIAQDPRDFQPHYLLGRHYGSDVEDFARAISYFRGSLARNAGHAPTHAYLGHALESLGDRTSAEASYGRALERNPCEAAALTGLARLGRASIPQLERCAGSDASVLQALAKALMTEGRPAEAAMQLEKAMAAERSNAGIAYQLYRAYQASGNQAKAGAALEYYRRIHDVYGGQ